MTSNVDDEMTYSHCTVMVVEATLHSAKDEIVDPPVMDTIHSCI